ncbi:neurogenic locus notch homolog protein 2-like [Haliotis cracherodii]|uniref:neurogenic locus notch homolog protein 2-like n=1 Tax=Haliotis cracherodii TaxID=6455 RepID=UPI0039EC0D77
MARSHVFLLVLGVVPAAAGLTCDLCKSNYDIIIRGVTDDEGKCSASKVYIQCLVSATGAGCDTRPVKLKVAKSEVDRIHSSVSTSCPLTDTCRCELDYYGCYHNSQLDECYASIVQHECAVIATGKECDEITTNAVFIVQTQQTWVNVCGGQQLLPAFSEKDNYNNTYSDDLM